MYRDCDSQYLRVQKLHHLERQQHLKDSLNIASEDLYCTKQS